MTKFLGTVVKWRKESQRLRKALERIEHDASMALPFISDMSSTGRKAIHVLEKISSAADKALRD